MALLGGGGVLLLVSSNGPIFFLSMHFLLLLLILLFMIKCSANSCFPYHHHHVAAAGNETDRLALLAFKAELIAGDPLGVLSSWNESNHFCKWVGVTCGQRHQRVTTLALEGLGLQGSISPHIGNLSFLRGLWLRNNSLSGNIPLEIGQLRRLQKVSLRNNSISGNIPIDISCCSTLVVIEFSLNNLSGEIPPEIGNSLSKLEMLRIRMNNITGVIPSTFGNLTSLKRIDATYNGISGIIPDSLGRLENLEILTLGANRLLDAIPSSIFNLSSIYALDFGVNQFQGKLPSDMAIALPNLQFFSVDRNGLTGSVPFSLSNASNLQFLQIGENQFTGQVPPFGNLHDLQVLQLSTNHLGTGGEANHDLSFISTLSNATSLIRLAFSDNNFGGVLPESLSNLSTNLNYLHLDWNNISGNISAGIGNLVSLELLSLSRNEFTGKIPDTMGKLKKLQELDLSDNNLSGNIPPFLGNLTLLTIADLGNNSFSGNIPSDVARCLHLVRLSLRRNNLNGTIPNNITSLSSLVYLYVHQNHLTGSLPVGIESLINLEELSVGGNKLSGEIPSTLGSCVKLRLLDMSLNNFHGIIPSSLRYLRGMEELNLSSNNLSGKIPDFLADLLFLQFLNLSMNDFEGSVPERGRIFTNSTEIDVSRNNKLCGGIPELHLPSCISRGSKRKRSYLALKIIIPTACGLVGLLLIMLFLYVSWSRLKKKKAPIFKVFENDFEKVSYGSLLKATGGFSSVNLIGVGGFGSVYKGTLDQDGKVVAVKVLNLEFRGASKSFIAECKALKNIKHRNLVKVLTACSGIDYHGNDFKALVYEFMVNGSLDEWLHPNEHKADKEPRSLNLLQRLNIAIDVASALDYLHHHTSEPIVHCDLKPSNVLLDDEMTGHVNDFGLARFLPKATTNHDSSSIGIRGSVGYAPVEYGMGNEVSTSGDVYSYGILLLEMFTGKRPTDSKFSDGLSLHKFVKFSLRDQVANIVDPTLLEQKDIGEASSSINHDIFQNQSLACSHKIEECLISVLEVGISCSEELPRNRMAINDTVSRLNIIRKTHFGTRDVHGGRREGILGRRECLSASWFKPPPHCTKPIKFRSSQLGVTKGSVATLEMLKTSGT